jgi:hypothetical protein
MILFKRVFKNVYEVLKQWKKQTDLKLRLLFKSKQRNKGNRPFYIQNVTSVLCT